jgi:hypothetical protein
VEKCGGARQATDGSIIRRMRFACWISKATNTLLECIVLTAFKREKFFTQNAPQFFTLYLRFALLYVSGEGR